MTIKKTEQEIKSEIEEIEKEQIKIGNKYRREIKELDKIRIALIDLLPTDEFEDLED